MTPAYVAMILSGLFFDHSTCNNTQAHEIIWLDILIFKKYYPLTYLKYVPTRSNFSQNLQSQAESLLSQREKFLYSFSKYHIIFLLLIQFLIILFFHTEQASGSGGGLFLNQLYDCFPIIPPIIIEMP